MLAAGLLPLMIGVLFAWLTGSWMFLAFAGMGAVTVLLPLLGGSARRRSFRVAIEEATGRDAARRFAAFPGADEFVVLAHNSHLYKTPSAEGRNFNHGSAPGQSLALRVGTANQPALLALSPAIGGYVPPNVGELPVTVPLSAGVLEVEGPGTAREELLNYVLMQLDAASIPVVVVGAVPDLPLSARFLPLTVLTASIPAAIAAVDAFIQTGDGPDRAGVLSCVLVSINETPDVVTRAFPNLRVIHFAPSEVDGLNPTYKNHVQLGVRANGVAGRFQGLTFIPDGVPAAVFSKYARDRGPSAHAVSLDMAPHGIPDPGKSTVEGVCATWRSNTNMPLRPVPIGHSQRGEELFNFSHDGPHLLVGGTTGSGKSEFLRTLVGSLAAAHSPADLQFVLLDFKGGAGLAPLQRFPHTTSIITDLNGYGMERTLASLRAEIHHREAVLGLADAADADADAYRARIAETIVPERSVAVEGSVITGHDRPGIGSMAHLVIVVDEFRVLVDQFPDAMAELMRIAAVGRSLGIHLVMATQRPQGALNADIRANVTSSVCLRVQTSFDSQDVIGSGVAAEISVDTPGRAFIRRAGTPPVEFQCGTLRMPNSNPAEEPTLELTTVVLATQDGTALAPREHPDQQTSGRQIESSDVASVAAMLTDAWHKLAGQDAVVSVAPPIVAAELPPDLDSKGTDFALERIDRESIYIGLVDVPERQSLVPLLWRPEQHSHMALIGRPSATSPVVGLLTEQLFAANSLRDEDRQRFLYLLDGDGSLESWSSHPQVGGYAAPHHLRTAVRLLSRLTEVASSTTSDLVLCISDWGRWVGSLRPSPWPWAEDALAALLRQGPVTVAIGGERELLNASFMAAIPNRIFLPHGSSAESRLLWPKMPRFTTSPGRAVIFGPVNATAAHGPADSAHIAQLARLDPSSPGNRPHGRSASPKSAPLPLMIADLSDNLSLADARVAVTTVGVKDTAGERRREAASIVVGLGGDGSTPISVEFTAGMVLPVLGGPGSGKSTFIEAVKALNSLPLGGKTVGSGGPNAILWVDDPATLSTAQQWELTQALTEGKSLVIALPNHLPSLARFPMEWGLRNAEQGVVLRPSRAQDGELFGARLDTDGSEPPGRAVLLERGRCVWFQFPH
ncbi:FtsK/SpoIIIE domain-containing protein [Arthrobacter sp. GMC3]|uniref:FtsK/SpoIIIE domain-containing protein n=1 Tax=Arthrobacter sp. GMC3 TaxID=2058894 RepID=UPI0015E2BC30|nr:FtsK/SpoIIIE domain-containing protein [Arthrobacter sp. GMC3]